MVIKCKNRTAQLMAEFLIIGLLSAFIVAVFRDGMVSVLLQAFWSMILSFVILKDAKCFSDNEQNLIKCGFAIRMVLSILVVVFLDSLGRSVLHIDATYFYDIARAYFNGDYSVYATKFPFLLENVYHVMGVGMLNLIMLNMLCWYFSLKMILNLCGNAGHIRYVVIFYACFEPYYMYLNINSLRETYMSFFIVASLYFMYKWMNNGIKKYVVYAAVLTIPAIYMHSANVALWVALYLIYVLWSPKMQKWFVSIKTVEMIVPAACAVILILWLRSKGYFAYLPMNVSIQSIVGYAHMDGNSDYLRGITADNIFVFAFWSIIKSIYFWISPMIYDARGIKDLFVIIVDSVPLAWIIYKSIIKRSRGDRRYLFGVICFLCYTFLYAWGTSNAGTAMRHRNMLLCMLLMTFAVRDSNACNDYPCLKSYR